MSLNLQSLVKIKSLKKKLTQKAQWSYLEALSDQKLAEEQLSVLKEQLDESDAAFDLSKSSETLSIEELIHWHHFRMTLKAGVAEKSRTVEVKRLVSEREKTDLTQRFQEEQVLDKLHQRKAKEAKILADKIQQNLLDELASNRFSRK